MRALRIDRSEDGTQARIQEMPVAELTDGNVLIRSHYSSINYKDALAVTGKGRILRRYPLNGGIDVAGVVEQSDDPAFAAGDEVIVTGYGLSEDRDGGYADYVRVPGDCVVPRPAGLSLFEAMGLGTAGFTAGFALRRLLQNDQTPELGPVAVTGATGGVGSYALQLLAAQGFEAVAVTRKVDSAGDYLKQLGAADVVTPEAIADDGKPLSKPEWGGAVDNVGGDLLARLLKQIRPYGNAAAIGLAGGIKLDASVLPFILRGVALLGIHSVECPMQWRRQIWEELAGPRKPANLEGIVRRVVGLDEVAELCQAMVAGEATGRTVVDLRAG